MSYITLLHMNHTLGEKHSSEYYSFSFFTKEDLTYHLKDFLEPGPSLH